MKNDRALVLKTDANCAWIAVLDPASGKRGRYTVHRIYRWADKGAVVVGREVDLRTARKLAGKREIADGAAGRPSNAGSEGRTSPNFDHDCDWRKATLMLAKCVVATLRTDGKIGVGSGMVMKVGDDGKKIVERWDKDFVEALAFIGIEVVDKKSNRGSNRRGAERRARRDRHAQPKLISRS